MTVSIDGMDSTAMYPSFVGLGVVHSFFLIDP